MDISFYNYDKENTSVKLMQDTLSSSTLHISVENNYSDEMHEEIKLYMSEDDVQDFINKLQAALNKRKNK